MDHAAQPAPAKRSRTPRKLNRQKVVELATAGVSTADIAQHQDVHPTSILRFLDQYKREHGDLTQYKANRADVLAWMQSRNMAIQSTLLDKLDRLVHAVTPQQISGLLFALNTQHGTLFDKERLERGQSSHNISVLSRMIDSTVDDIYKPQHIDDGIRSTPENEEKPNNINGPNV